MVFDSEKRHDQIMPLLENIIGFMESQPSGGDFLLGENLLLCSVSAQQQDANHEQCREQNGGKDAHFQVVGKGA